MKKTLFTIICITILGTAFSQNPLPVGKTQLNAGLGFSSWGIPVYIGFDYGIHKDITLGAEFSFRSYHENWNNGKYDHNILGFSGNANYHFNSIFNIPQNFDFYVGLNVGFYSWSSNDDYHGDNVSGLGLGAQIGGRYFFSDKVGLNLEFGGGNAFSGGKIGLTFKL